MTQIAPTTTAPAHTWLDFDIAKPKFLGMGTRNEDLNVRETDQGTEVSLITYYMVEADYRTLSPEQVAQRPDVLAGVEQVRSAYAALTDAELPAPAVDKVWPEPGDVRFSRDGIRLIEKGDTNPARAALRDAVYGLAELVRTHVPKPV